MVLIMAPAIDGLKREWREAAENMGGSSAQYWRYVALPILTPTILGTMILLFGNAFGAQATAYQLTGGTLPIVTLVLSAQLRGDVLNNVGLGYAIAMGMVVIMGCRSSCTCGSSGAQPGGSDEADPSLVVDRLPHRLPVLLRAARSGHSSSRSAIRSAQPVRRHPSSSTATSWPHPTRASGASLAYSFVIGTITIIVSVGLLLPTAFWVRLRVPRARPFVEFITLLPFVIPPIVLVFGLISTFSHPPLPFTYTDIGSSALLTFAYVVLSFPYMYRAIDTGLQSIDIRSLTEAAQSLGASWPRIIVQVILPNVRVALLSGAFLTLAIVVGEFTIATFLARPAFGPYLSLLGQTKAYEPAAASIISFALTWMAMILIAFIGRGSRTRVAVTGAR